MGTISYDDGFCTFRKQVDFGLHAHCSKGLDNFFRAQKMVALHMLSKILNGKGSTAGFPEILNLLRPSRLPNNNGSVRVQMFL